MINPLYLHDSYLREFVAEVIETNEVDKAVVLSNTAFYPAGGGQPSDHGSLEFEDHFIEVTSVKKIDGRIWHFIESDPLQKGTIIKGTIDWSRRYKLMRTHTAMHALSAIAWRDHQAQVTGGNMEPLLGRLDFEFENFTGDLVAEIEKKVNIEIKKGLKVISRILPRIDAEKIPDLIRTKINLLPASLSELRVVEIESLDLQADGGTHVANTSEIGTIKITGYKSKGKINKRIKFELV
jgi:misacylated tRNA(Ala) deacylase